MASPWRVTSYPTCSSTVWSVFHVGGPENGYRPVPELGGCGVQDAARRTASPPASVTGRLQIAVQLRQGVAESHLEGPVYSAVLLVAGVRLGRSHAGSIQAPRGPAHGGPGMCDIASLSRMSAPPRRTRSSLVADTARPLALTGRLGVGRASGQRRNPSWWYRSGARKDWTASGSSPRSLQRQAASMSCNCWP